MREKTAITLLKERTLGLFKILLRHVQKVRQIAVQIAKQIPDADMQLVKTGALLHDIGRVNCPPQDKKKSHWHGVEGGNILRGYRLEKEARIAERHLGGGIDKKEAKKLGFPDRIYTPLTIEEKIVCYADKLVEYDKKIPIKKTIVRFEKEVGKDAANKIKKLHNYLIKKGMKGDKL